MAMTFAEDWFDEIGWFKTSNNFRFQVDKELQTNLEKDGWFETLDANENDDGDTTTGDKEKEAGGEDADGVGSAEASS